MKSTLLSALLAATFVGLGAAGAVAGTLSLSFKPAEGTAPTYKELTVQVVHLKGPGDYELLFDETIEGTTFERTWSDLPEGRFVVVAGTGKEDEWENAERPGAFFHQEMFILKKDEKKEVSISAKPFDIASVKGDLTHTVTYSTFGGEPIAGKELALIFNSRSLGPAGPIEIGRGTTDAKGQVAFQGLAKDAEYLVIEVEEEDMLGRVKGGADDGKSTFKLPPSAGDMAPDFTVRRLADGSPMKLSELKGKVVVVDFWATWCGPCQPAVEKLDKLAKEKKEAWAGKVELVALSVDETEDADKVVEHMNNKGWNSVTRAWVGPEGFGHDAPRAYGINWIPQMIVIDRDGRIVERGNPHSMDYAGAVERLLSAAAPTENKGG